MTDPEDPPRLFEEASGAPERARRLLDESRRDVATDGRIHSLEARLAPMLWGAPPAPGPHAPAAGAKAATLGTLKAAAVAIAVAGAAGVWIATKPPAKPEPPPARPPAPAVNAPVAPAPASPEPPAAIVPEPAVSAEPPSPAKPALPAPRRSPAAVADTAAEMTLLGQARAALGSNPGQALALAEQHRRQFNHPVLVQEREVIAIEALSRLGRRAEAAGRADRFRAAFPGSAYRSKIDGLVAPR